MTYTDNQLKQALAKMLPDFIAIGEEGDFFWHSTDRKYNLVLDTELLHICWLIEETLNTDEIHIHKLRLLTNGYWMSIHASWQQRTIALAMVKGIEI